MRERAEEQQRKLQLDAEEQQRKSRLETELEEREALRKIALAELRRVYSRLQYFFFQCDLGLFY